MNQRNSSGLPLRAMVMVLLFLGVVFLLVGFQAMGSGDDEGDQSSSIATTTITTTQRRPRRRPPEPAKADVRVFNISEIAGRRGRHGQPAARGRLERHRDRQPEPAGRRRPPRCSSATRRASGRPPTRWASCSRRRCNRGCPNWPSNRRAWSWRSPARLLHMLKTVAVAALLRRSRSRVERVQRPERTRRHLTGHHAVGLDRLAVTVGPAR